MDSRTVRQYCPLPTVLLPHERLPIQPAQLLHHRRVTGDIGGINELISAAEVAGEGFDRLIRDGCFEGIGETSGKDHFVGAVKIMEAGEASCL